MTYKLRTHKHGDVDVTLHRRAKCQLPPERKKSRGQKYEGRVSKREREA